MGTLEDRAKELAAPLLAQRQKEQEARRAAKRQQEQWEREAPERERQSRAVGREFVALANKYGVGPLRLYETMEQHAIEQDSNDKWRGKGFIAEVWIVLSSTPWARTYREGRAFSAAGDSFEFLAFSDDVLQGALCLPLFPYYKDKIEEAAARIVAGEPTPPIRKQDFA